MIRRLLVLLDHGAHSFSELARVLGLSQVELRNRLEMLARMGYLESVQIPGDSGDPEGACPGCVLSGRCKRGSCSEEVPTVGFRMTEKGQRVARSRPGGDRGAGP